MKKKESGFKSPTEDIPLFNSWISRLSQINQRSYHKYELDSSLGNTIVYGHNINEDHAENLVIFPGFRTTSLFWDFDRNLDAFNEKINIYLVETNGQPNLSDGFSPGIKSDHYGEWGLEIISKLGLDQCYIAGSSFGGLVVAKIGKMNPSQVKAGFLLNPGCLQKFSLKWKNLYNNLLPLMRPNPKTVQKFLDKVVLNPSQHSVSTATMDLLVDYQLIAIKRYRDKTEKPYFMADELEEVKLDCHLIMGDHDILFPYEKSIQNAEKYLKRLKSVDVFPGIAHGIEVYRPALEKVNEIILNKAKSPLS